MAGVVVRADADRWRVAAAHRIARDPQAEANCIGGVGDSEHERVADCLHILAVNAWEFCPNGIRELLDQLQGLLVPMRLREGCKARDVGEQEGGFSIPCHG
jgi:hypothetical protein